ncbi:hypothetical protein SynBMKMC1_02319 [Synechococcus sp. BMK-MC-1]|nr:hypothetical protein SynBMKMC1_02319 [Synechococcus sp. BMK-MC-1]
MSSQLAPHVIPSQVHLDLFDGALMNATRQQAKPIESRDGHLLSSNRGPEAQGPAYGYNR